MLLTGEIINSSRHFINEANERELDLRSKGIKQIANTHLTLNYFQSIDLSENQIEVISNFSYLDGLKTLVLSNNKIRKINQIGQNLPNLQNLFLLGNKISELQEVYNLKSCPNLKRLVLINNPVSSKQHYRKLIIHHLKSLIALDFKAITNKQRNEAEAYLLNNQLIHS